MFLNSNTQHVETGKRPSKHFGTCLLMRQPHKPHTMNTRTKRLANTLAKRIREKEDTIDRCQKNGNDIGEGVARVALRRYRKALYTIALNS